MSEADSWRGRTIRGRDLSGARLVECDLRGMVVRGSELAGVELDSPWLMGGGSLVVNGVDVVPLVDAELNRRFPGREQRTADEPEGLRTAWQAVESAWAEAGGRAARLPAGSVDVSVSGEWSFAQTMSHLIFATDVWLGMAVLEKEHPLHPLGLPNDDGGGDSAALAGFTPVDAAPRHEDVLEARAERQAMVRDFLAAATPALLAEPRRNPHAPTHAETVLSCLHTILEEEWEHLRYAVRDLEVLATEEGLRADDD